MKFRNFIGQLKAKKQLTTFVFPMLKTQQECDHILLEGSSGTGKTTLAKIIAYENNLVFKSIIASIIKTKADLISIFCDIKKGSIVFIDEIHRLSVEIEEMLYQIMDDKQLNILVGKEGDSQYIKVDIPKFTIIGATTLSGLLSKPLKDRFGFRIYMQEYQVQEIEKIIEQNLVIKTPPTLISYISQHSRNIPRLAINITKRLNEYSSFTKKKLTKKIVDNVLDLIGYKLGFEQQDLEYLQLLEREGPLSITSIATKMSMEKINIISDIEPYLFKKSFVNVSSKGRSITKKGLLLLQKVNCS